MTTARGTSRHRPRRDRLDAFKRAQAAIQAANQRARDTEPDDRTKVDR